MVEIRIGNRKYEAGNDIVMGYDGQIPIMLRTVGSQPADFLARTRLTMLERSEEHKRLQLTTSSDSTTTYSGVYLDPYPTIGSDGRQQEEDRAGFPAQFQFKQVERRRPRSGGLWVFHNHASRR